MDIDLQFATFYLTKVLAISKNRFSDFYRGTQNQKIRKIGKFSIILVAMTGGKKTSQN